jgi:hypothetical protein
MSKPILEPAAQAFADAAAKPPLLYGLGAAGARKVLDDIQAAPIDKLDLDENPEHGRSAGSTAAASRSPVIPWAAT